MTALNAILARQGMMNPQAGVMNGQQGLPIGGLPQGGKPQFTPSPLTGPNGFGVDPAKPAVSQLAYVSQLPSNSYNLDPRQNAQFNALSPQDQARYYQGGMNPQSGISPQSGIPAGLTNSSEINPFMQSMSGQGQGYDPQLNYTYISGMQPAQNQAGVIAPPSASMAAQPLAGAGPFNQAPQLAPPLTGMANPAQAVTAAPVQGSGPIYENQINRLMTNQGMSREQAIANQASAVRQGGDFNNDGTVTKEEYRSFLGQQSNLAEGEQLLEQGPQTGLLAAEQSLEQGSRGLTRAGDQAIIDLTGGTQQARSDITNASQAALQPLAGYARSGQDANTMQANLLGANGPAAQAAAMQQFQDSPGQAYLREEQERAVLRNAAATGGTQGGAVLEELQRRAYGLAGTAFNDRVAQLGGLGSQGLTASQGQAGIMGDTGIALSGLAERGAGNLASTRLGIAGQQAGIQGTIAGGRTRAGEQMAQNIGSTTANLANLQNAEGAALAQILDGGQFAEIMAKAGITDANTLQQLATLLANISTGQGSQATGLGGIPGVTQTEGALAGIGKAAAGAGAAMSGYADMSDIRLKENIVPIGKIGRHNFYTWDWKAEALPIVGNQGTVGVIAQEAQKISPDAVFEVDGILKVDYSRIF